MGLRVYPGGREAFILQWRDETGRSRRATLGQASGMREAAALIRAMPRLCDFVFPNRSLDGLPGEGELAWLWQTVRRQAGLQDVRLHDLRHTYASIAMRHGVHVVTLSRRRYGHDPEIRTFRQYRAWPGRALGIVTDCR